MRLWILYARLRRSCSSRKYDLFRSNIIIDSRCDVGAKNERELSSVRYPSDSARESGKRPSLVNPQTHLESVIILDRNRSYLSELQLRRNLAYTIHKRMGHGFRFQNTRIIHDVWRLLILSNEEKTNDYKNFEKGMIYMKILKNGG
jgi:hypothetical protein